MPAKDFYHDRVKVALTKEGWTITDDPLPLKLGKRDLFVDLGAERLLGARKGKRKIAVEVKSFVGASEVTELERSLGQCVLYEDVLSISEPDRSLYLAISEEVAAGIFSEPLGQLLIARNRFRLLVFDPNREEISKWIP